MKLYSICLFATHLVFLKKKFILISWILKNNILKVQELNFFSYNSHLKGFFKKWYWLSISSKGQSFTYAIQAKMSFR